MESSNCSLPTTCQANAFELQNVLHMNGGDEKHSYARNSATQRASFIKVIPMLEETVKAMYTKSFSHQRFVIADLGCSSGPNALFAVSVMIKTILNAFKQENHRLQTPPAFMVFLNDLPSNDFNSVFRSLPEFHREFNIKGGNGQKGLDCFVAAVPGSFYGRLFPDNSLHFVHSSCSLHWLSQVPEGIKNNKGNIWLSKSSPHNVSVAYMKQFRRDFSLFLSSRGEELVVGGQMMLMFYGRCNFDATTIDCCPVWNMLGSSLLEMAEEGLIEEDLVDSFNVPFYAPHPKEVRDMVENEGSFEIDRLETSELNWDLREDDVPANDSDVDKDKCARIVAGCTRAISEPLLSTHFGEGKLNLDDLFERYTRHARQYLSTVEPKYCFLVICLSKKELH